MIDVMTDHIHIQQAADIVERLRDRGVGSNDHGDAKHLMLDAADEIARLRANQVTPEQRAVLDAAERWRNNLGGFVEVEVVPVQCAVTGEEVDDLTEMVQPRRMLATVSARRASAASPAQRPTPTTSPGAGRCGPCC